MSARLFDRLATTLQAQPVYLATADESGVQRALVALAADKPVDHQALRAETEAAYGSDGLSEKPFVFAAGVAVVPVHGLLINRFLGSWGFITGYEHVQRMTELAESDPDVRAILYDIHSPGGLATGTLETWQTIRAAKKPTVAMVDSAAYSAAYFLASAAKKIYITPTGGAGSIGAYRMRVDFTKALETEGVKVDIIFAGANKLDGHPMTEMSDEERARHQASVDEAYETFVQAVATGRRLAPESVRATEAGCFGAAECLRLGLVDGIMGARDALAAMARTENIMSATEPNPIVNVAEVRAAERQRFNGIMSSEAAKTRPILAAYLAGETELTVEQALGVLATAEKDKPIVAAAEENPLEAAMNRQGSPNVGDDPDTDTQPAHLAAAQRILSAHRAATGISHVTKQ
jgi:signal peptide peptidase SppA